MKKYNWLLIVGGVYLAWYLLRKKKTGASAPSAVDAASTARVLVADAVDNTTFVPDTTTFKDQYLNDQSECK